jgi:hypothetical protein
MGPFSHSNGCNALGLGDELSPWVAGGVYDGVVVLDGVRAASEKTMSVTDTAATMNFRTIVSSSPTQGQIDPALQLSAALLQPTGSARRGGTNVPDAYGIE